MVERNELTAILEAEREDWGAQAEALFGGEEFQRLPHLRGITLLLVVGVQYLLVRARKTRVFSGIDVGSNAGWRAIKASVAAMARQMLAAPRDGIKTQAKADKIAVVASTRAPKKATG
jgi:hypothetical protein